MKNDIGGAARQMRHIELNDAIDSIIPVVARARALAERIRGEPRCEENTTVAVQVPPGLSLLYVLECGPSSIRTQCEAIIDELRVIESMLF